MGIQKKGDEPPSNVGVGRVLRLSVADWPFLLTALLASFAIGATMPVYAYLFSEVQRSAKGGPRLRECCKLSQAEVVSKSRNKIHQTWGPLFSRAL